MLTIHKLPGTELADVVYAVDCDSRRAIELGVKLRSMLGQQVYLTLAIRDGARKLTRGDWRSLRHHFSKAFDPWHAYCEIEEGNTTNCRFVEFFGFTYSHSGRGRSLYERKK